jgi:hypothetical protein
MLSTAFVPTDGKITAQSYHPRHIFGDGNIYGVGVRWSFYINYFAGTIALWYGVREDITSSRFVLTAIAFALWVALLKNSTGDSLVILDWSIALLLITFLPLYSIWRRMFHGTVSVQAWWENVHLKVTSEEEKQLAVESEEITDQYRELTEKLLELDRFQTWSEQYTRAFQDYQMAVHSFVQTGHFQNQGYQMLTPQELQRLYIQKMSEIYSQGVDTDRGMSIMLVGKRRMRESSSNCANESTPSPQWDEIT